MPVALDFGAVFDLGRVRVDVDPVQLGGVVHDGGDEAFALPAPLVVWVAEEVAREGVGGRFFEFEGFVRGGVDVELGFEPWCELGGFFSLHSGGFFGEHLRGGGAR